MQKAPYSKLEKASIKALILLVLLTIGVGVRGQDSEAFEPERARLCASTSPPPTSARREA